MSSFWEQQDRARGRSFLLVALFILSVLVTLAAINFAVALVVRWDLRQDDGWRWLWDARTAGITSAATLAIIAGGAFLKSRELRIGGAAIADMIGGEPIAFNAQTVEERRVLNVVEEMALASGMPVPPVYVMKFEFCLNAFAAGHTPRDAVIGISQGALDKLTRDELQALVGHEFSHIFNGDMRLNMRLTFLLHGLMAVSLAGRALVFSSFRLRGPAPSGGRLFAPLWLTLGLIFWIIGWIGNICGRAIQAAICRQREYLADASAIQYTRHPESLAGVLKKAGWYNSWLRNPYAVVANHFLFGDCFGDSAFRLFRTHPRLIDRIRRVDPAFHGDYRRAIDELKFPAPSMPDLDDRRDASGRKPASPPGAAIPMVAAADRMGVIGPGELKMARETRHRIPPTLDEAARSPMTAVALVYALAIGGTKDLRDRQLRLIATHDPAMLADTRPLLDRLNDRDTEARLTLAQISVTALRQLSREQYARFRDCLHKLVGADRQVSLLEFALEKLVLRQLDPGFDFVEEEERDHGPPDRVLETRAPLVLSALAHAGRDEPPAIRAAFSNGLRRLPSGHAAALVSLKDCNLDDLNTALDALNTLELPKKRAFIEACAATIEHDGEIRPAEITLFRAICGALDLPCPPLTSPRAASRAGEPV